MRSNIIPSTVWENLKSVLTTPQEKLLYMHLISCKERTQSGLFLKNPASIEEYTGLELAAQQDAFSGLSEKGLAHFDPSVNAVWIADAFYHIIAASKAGVSANTLISVKRDMEVCRRSALSFEFLRAYYPHCGLLAEGLTPALNFCFLADFQNLFFDRAEAFTDEYLSMKVSRFIHSLMGKGLIETQIGKGLHGGATPLGFTSFNRGATGFSAVTNSNPNREGAYHSGGATPLDHKQGGETLPIAIGASQQVLHLNDVRGTNPNREGARVAPYQAPWSRSVTPVNTDGLPSQFDESPHSLKIYYIFILNLYYRERDKRIRISKEKGDRDNQEYQAVEKRLKKIVAAHLDENVVNRLKFIIPEKGDLHLYEPDVIAKINRAALNDDELVREQVAKGPRTKPEPNADTRAVIDALNRAIHSVTGKMGRYRNEKGTAVNYIVAAFRAGYTVQDLIDVVQHKAKNDEFFRQNHVYLRPSTLFALSDKNLPKYHDEVCHLRDNPKEQQVAKQQAPRHGRQEPSDKGKFQGGVRTVSSRQLKEGGSVQ